MAMFNILPPPEDQSAYDQWRRDVITLELADQVERQDRKLFQILIVAVAVVALYLPGLFQSLGWPLPGAETIVRSALVGQAASVIALCGAAFVQWRFNREMLRIDAAHRALDRRMPETFEQAGVL